MMTGTIPDEDPSYQFKWSMLAMVGFGFGEIFGGFIVGYVVDRWGSKYAILVNLAMIIAMFGVTIGFIVQFEFNFLAWLMCFLWGLQDSGINTQL